MVTLNMVNSKFVRCKLAKSKLVNVEAGNLWIFRDCLNLIDRIYKANQGFVPVL